MGFVRRVFSAIITVFLLLCLTELSRIELCRGYGMSRSRGEISFPLWRNWLNRFYLPLSHTWYYVHFYDRPDSVALRAKGIGLPISGRIRIGLYALYLSRDNASFLLRANLAEVALVTDKIYYTGVSLREADFLMVETAPVFDVKAFPSIRFARIGEGGYVAESDDLQRAAAVLSKCPEVFSITATKHPELN